MTHRILQLVIISVTICVGCGKNNIELTNQLNKCTDLRTSHQTQAYQIGAATVKLPTDWRVRSAETATYKVIEAADTVEFSQSLKILTFTITESESDGTKLSDYFESEVALMKVDTMKLGILGTGTRSIAGTESFYAITTDTIQGVVLHQLFVYSANRKRNYTIQVGSSDMKDPVSEFCKYLWLIDSIRFQ